MKPHEKVQDVLDSMVGIGGVPNDCEFYEEFNFWGRAKMGIKSGIKNKSPIILKYPLNPIRD
mgnify:CR=1 FL=1